MNLAQENRKQYIRKESRYESYEGKKAERQNRY